MTDSPANDADTIEIPFREAVHTWMRVAALSFGGPAGQIAVMHRILVEEKRWISETRFLHALNYCMLLPGPEAHELAIYVGWLLHKVRGGLVAGVLFVLPGLLALTALSLVYVTFGQIGVVQAVFFGLKCAVLAVVLEAVQRVGKRALKSRGLVAVAVAAFVCIFFLQVPFPFIVVAAAAAGLAAQATGQAWFVPSTAQSGAAARAEPRLPPPHVRPSLRRALTTLVLGLAIWLGPLLILLATVGAGNVFAAIALFNSKMAVVTFGGAYAVMAYMAQQAVEHYHWLKPGEMLVGLGFAETTPGPLISVVQFVGFLAAWRQPGALDPALAGVLGGFLAMWATFVPPFIWIFVGGPYIEALIGNKSLNAALSAVTAAVVGVIVNLAAWFALHTMFASVTDLHLFALTLAVPHGVNWAAVILSLVAIVAMFRFKAGMAMTFAGCSAAGVAYFLLTGAL